MFFRQLIPAVLYVAVAYPALAQPQTQPSPGADEAVTWQSLADPSPLGAREEANTATALLARRYNPAMAFAHKHVWPVPVSYAWHDGSALVAKVLTSTGQVVQQFIALPHEKLARNQWGDLPSTDAHGNPLQYRVDAPGDDRLQDGVSGWRTRWQAIMQIHAKTAADDPRDQPYRPTQYAHLYWLNRDRGLLVVQYWFYYPYNEWINHHEGDWEHINVILQGPTRLRSADDFHPVGYQFFFHEFVHEPQKVIRVGGSDPREDHVVVYVGGKSYFYDWSGIQSGGSYPLPAQYPAAGGGFGKWRPADDIRKPTRFVRPDDFDLTMLPEPDRLDVGVHPELSWLRLNFFAGQEQMHHNPLTLNGVVYASTPRQPARQDTWNSKWTPRHWQGTPDFKPGAPALPRGWTALVNPPDAANANHLSARRALRRRSHPVPTAAQP